MIISILGEDYHYSKLNSEEIIIEIESKLNHTEQIFCYMIVNGQEVKDDFEIYLSEKCEIEKIEVITKSLNEYTNEVIITLGKYFENSLVQIEELSNQFYTDPTKKDWEEFNYFLEGVQWLFSVVNLVKESKMNYKNWDKIEHISLDIENMVINLQEGIEQNDYIHIADLLNYEILPLLRDLVSSIQGIIDSEVLRNDLN